MCIYICTHTYTHVPGANERLYEHVLQAVSDVNIEFELVRVEVLRC